MRPTQITSGSTWRAILQTIPGLAALVVAVTGMVIALPPSSALQARRVGVENQRDGNLPAAVSAYQAVLRYDPNAAYTRGLLACALWREGRSALAAEELYRAAMQGWIPRLQGACGGDVNISLFFATAPVGPEDIIVIFRSPATPSLVTTARDGHNPLAQRLAAAACLGMNAGFTAFGVEPLAEAARLKVPESEIIADLHDCLTAFLSWFQCAPVASNNCVLTYNRELVRRQELAFVGISGG